MKGCRKQYGHVKVKLGEVFAVCGDKGLCPECSFQNPKPKKVSWQQQTYDRSREQAMKQYGNSWPYTCDSEDKCIEKGELKGPLYTEILLDEVREIIKEKAVSIANVSLVHAGDLLEAIDLLEERYNKKI